MIYKQNRSFSRRIGKTLSTTQKNLLQEQLPLYLIDPDLPLNNIPNSHNIFLEIGIGMGEHFITQASYNPESIFLGLEPYLNGIANSLKLAQAQNITNIRLWPNNAESVLYNIPSLSLSGIYILFPDPWPKHRQQKRRFINRMRIEVLYNLLKPQGFFIFATDVANYFNQVLILAEAVGFTNHSTKDFKPYEYYSSTRYHKKAEIAGKKAQFLNFTK